MPMAICLNHLRIQKSFHTSNSGKIALIRIKSHLRSYQKIHSYRTMHTLFLLAVLLTRCLPFAQDATYTHPRGATGPDYPNFTSRPLFVKLWYTRYCEGYSYNILRVRHGQLWPVQFQSYHFFQDLSDKKQMDLFDTLPAGRAFISAYSENLVTYRCYVDPTVSRYPLSG